jgi:hypothetical protein
MAWTRLTIDCDIHTGECSASATAACTDDSARPAFPKLVGREKFLKCDFFNYIKIKNHKKCESEKTKQN